VTLDGTQPDENVRANQEWLQRYTAILLLGPILAWLGIAWWAIASFGSSGRSRLLSDPLGLFAGLQKKYPVPLVAGSPADGLQIGDVPPGQLVASLVHVDLPLLLLVVCLGSTVVWGFTVVSWAARAVIGRAGAAS